MAQKRAKRWILAIPILLIAALTGLLSLVMIGFETGLIGFLIGFVMAAIPVPFYLAFSLWIDRFEPEPPWLLALAFIWGAAIATFFSMISNTINGLIFAAVAGEATGQTLGAVLSAPFVEEIAKGLALLLLFWWQRREFDSVTDGIVYAIMVGLGFAMTENILYYGRAVAQQGAGAVTVFVLRGMLSPFAHPLFTSMTGIGFGFARESDRKGVKIAAPIIGLFCAMFLHFLWNLSGSLGAIFFITYLVIMVPAFIALMVVVVFSLKREARIIRLHLERISDEGIVSSEDITALCSVRGRIGASYKALREGGFGAWRARTRFHRVATEYAFHSWRESRGVVTRDTQIGSEMLNAVRVARVEAGLPAIAEPPAPEIVRRYTMEAPVPNVTVQAESRGALVFTAGPLKGQTFPLGFGGLVIGRDPSFSQVIVSDGRVSKKHAWVGFQDGQLVVVDRNSTNGTFVGGKRIRTQAISAGEEIRLSDAAAFQVRGV